MEDMTDHTWPGDLSDTTAVVTGANSGIGLEATRALAGAGAHVVMACRSRDRAEAARDDVAADDPDGSLAVADLDLASLDSVAAFADGLADDHDAVDLLVNNAGVMAIPRRETGDGFETQFGVNHLGHFALTGHLLDLLQAGDDPRVVAVSSGAHESGEVDFEDLNHEDDYGRWEAYGQSKLANLLFAFELDRRADGVTALGCHPGYAATNLQHRTAAESGSLVERFLLPAANRLVGQSPARGAEPTVYAATHPDVDGGEYVGPTGLLNMRGAPGVQDPADQARDEAAAERLWERSEALTGVEYL
jgi:NAD(P)-dependent dehydrogenase (short-subunit alcohol dehydrogenase family)